jgi:TolB-like protein
MRTALGKALTCVILVTCGSALAEELPAAARRTADALATALMSSAEAAGVKQVGVLPFAEGPGTSGQGKAVTDLLGARFAQVARVGVVDAEAFRTVVGEQKLQAMMGSGKADDPAIASRVGAQAVITGSVAHDGAGVRINARLTLVTSGKVLGTAQAFAEAPPKASPAATAGGGDSGSIEAAMRRLSDGLAGGFAKLPGNARYRRLAVLTFGEVGERAAKKKLGTIVTAEVATNLKRDHGLFLVERAKLGEVLSEMRLQEMTSPDASQASRIGKMADAQALVLGSVAEAGDRYLVTARIVSTETGEALAAESVSVPEAGLAAIAADAVVLRSRGDALMRSLLFPGLGQSYNRQTAKAIAFAGTELALLGAAAAYHLAGNQAHDEYLKVGASAGGSPSAEATRLYDLASSRYTTRNWLLIGGAGVWVVNLVDAWVSGVDGQELLGGGATAQASGGRGAVTLLPVPSAGGVGLALTGRF